MKTFIISLFLLIQPTFAKTPKDSLKNVMNQIVTSNLAFYKAEAVKKISDSNLKLGALKDPEGLWPRIIDKIKNQDYEIEIIPNGLNIKSEKTILKIELVDLIDQIYLINGTPVQIKPNESVSDLMIRFEKIINPKMSYSRFFVNDAHATPLVLLWVIPPLLVVGAAVAFVDTVMGRSLAGLNQKEAVARIKELTEDYKNRVTSCRSDLEEAESKIGQQTSIEGLSAVQVIAKLHREFNADLGEYSDWNPLYKDFEYSDFGCDQIREDEGFDFRSAHVGFRINWFVMGPLCDQISKLNSCLLKVEELMEGQNVEIQQVFDPPRNNPLYQTVEDYRGVEQ